MPQHSLTLDNLVHLQAQRLVVTALMGSRGRREIDQHGLRRTDDPEYLWNGCPP